MKPTAASNAKNITTSSRMAKTGTELFEDIADHELNDAHAYTHQQDGGAKHRLPAGGCEQHHDVLPLHRKKRAAGDKGQNREDHRAGARLRRERVAARLQADALADHL